MSSKPSRLRRGALSRSLSVSLAGLRAGGALAVDGAWKKVTGGDSSDSAFARREARLFVNELGKLKGTYVKIGQMLALFGEHFLPPVLTQALHELHDSTEPLPWAEIEPALRGGLGERYDELDIEPRALAAASLAQVHRASIRATGEQICLKVQYPGLTEVVDADFDAVVRMLVLARWVQTGRDLDDWLESLREHLHHEIDYRREARLTQSMADRVSATSLHDADLHVPTLYLHYCSDTVLAMEYIDGFSVNAAEVAGLSMQRRNGLARAMLELFFVELYDWGSLQTDPNFGNYLLRLEDRRRSEATDELVLLDFGSVLECDEYFLHHLRGTIAAGLEGDRGGVVEGLIGLECLVPDANPEARDLFADFCLNLLEPLRHPDQLPAQHLNGDGEYRWAHSRLMQRAGKQAALSTTSRHFTTPSRDFALIARKLTGVFTFIAVLDAQFNAWDLVQVHIQRWRNGAG